MVRKALAWTAFCFALSVLGAEAMLYADSGHYETLKLDDVWRSLSPASHILVEDMIIAKLSVKIWDPGMTTVLAAPIWLALAALGVGIYPWLRSSRYPPSGRR